MDNIFCNFTAYSKQDLFKKARFIYNSIELTWIIILIGIMLRLVQYLFNRSLWLDESFLAVNIVNKSFSQLFLPLDYFQAAPIGFLLIEKLFVEFFGNNEYALRLFPLLSGIISLFLFYKVGKYYIKPKALPIALGLFAISSPLIYYSSEVKPYSSDVAFCLIIYSVTIYIMSKRMNIRNIAIFGVVGAIAIWFSYTSIFVLLGVGITYSFNCLKNKDQSILRGVIIVYFLWFLSLVIYYLFSLHNLSNSQILLDFWKSGFMPFPTSLSELIWFPKTFYNLFQDPMGFSVHLPNTIIAALTFAALAVAMLTFLLGCISIFFRNKERFSIIISPSLFVLLASGFHLYPFSGRLILFIVPSIILFIAEGAELIMNKTMHDSTTTALIGIVLIGVLFFYPILSACQNLINPITLEEVKPVMSYMKEHKHNGDSIYLYYASQPAFKYYSESYGFKDNNTIVGIVPIRPRDNKPDIIDLDKLHGKKRVWILFSHVYGDDDIVFLSYLDKLGTRLDSFKSTGASVYLYDIK